MLEDFQAELSRQGFENCWVGSILLNVMLLDLFIPAVGQYPRTVSPWRNNDEILHKTLATGEASRMSDHEYVIFERKVSVVYSQAVHSCRSFGC